MYFGDDTGTNSRAKKSIDTFAIVRINIVYLSSFFSTDK